MPEEAEVITAPETEPAKESFEERGMKFVEQQFEAIGAATESATAEAVPTPEAPVAAEAKTETPAVEPKTEPEPEPFTAEQMSDDAFFDKLDKAGWERLEKLHPALFKMGKAVASARGKAFARLKGLPEPPKEEPNVTPKPDDLTEAIKAAKRKRDSLDEDESLRGELELAELLTQQREEKRNAARAAQQKEMDGILANAQELAVAEEPEIANVSEDDLDAVVAKSPRMKRALSAAIHHPDSAQRAQLIADVMVDAFGVIKSTRQSATATEAKRKADEKAEADKARLRSNANNPAAPIAETPSGKSQNGAKTFEKDGLNFIQSQLNTAATPVR